MYPGGSRTTDVQLYGRRRARPHRRHRRAQQQPAAAGGAAAANQKQEEAVARLSNGGWWAAQQRPGLAPPPAAQHQPPSPSSASGPAVLGRQTAFVTTAAYAARQGRSLSRAAGVPLRGSGSGQKRLRPRLLRQQKKQGLQLHTRLLFPRVQVRVPWLPVRLRRFRNLRGLEDHERLRS